MKFRGHVMKKLLATALIAGTFVASGAVAEEIQPLTTTASSQADSLETLPPEVVFAGLGLILFGIAIAGSSSNGT
jgi:hypothetical protein